MRVVDGDLIRCEARSVLVCIWLVYLNCSVHHLHQVMFTGNKATISFNITEISETRYSLREVRMECRLCFCRMVDLMASNALEESFELNSIETAGMHLEQ